MEPKEPVLKIHRTPLLEIRVYDMVIRTKESLFSP
jgi:hypothetical protein